MKTLARVAAAAVTFTYLHLVFGGVVRITGSGMGCGDHWPKCNGSWIPPFSSPLVMIEWTHRLLALLVILSIGALVITAWRRRADARVAGRGGVLRPAALGLALVIVVALLGMVTVKLGNTTLATVAHWTLALALLAVVSMAAIRAGAFGGDAARADGGTVRAVRSIGAGAALAFIAVVLGGLVAKYPGAAAACPNFPLCGDTPAGIVAGAAHIQVTHRVIAFLLVFHSLAIALAVGRRAGEASVVKRAAMTASALVLVQLIVAAAMIMGGMPPLLRSAHQAIGIAVWMVLFMAAYLARTAAKSRGATQ
jgi:cytochrome c oxidase assembly protein subunit 15